MAQGLVTSVGGNLLSQRSGDDNQTGLQRVINPFMIANKEGKPAERVKGVAKNMFDPFNVFNTHGSGSGSGSGSGDEFVEPYPGYLSLGGALTSEIESRLGQLGTPYPYSFEIPQPAIESQLESYISDRMANAAEIKKSMSEEATRTYEAQKARQAQSFEDERRKTQERYNRLGLASSTPGMQALQDIDRDETVAQEALAADLAQQELQYQLDAENAVNEIFNTVATQGQALGAAQRSYNQYPITMGYEDFTRVYDEPYKWASLGTSLIGQQEPAYNAESTTGSFLGGLDLGSIVQLIGSFRGGSSGSTGTTS